MEKHRKPDYFYIDNYDRWTIRTLKELEAKEAAEMQDVDDPIKRFAIEVVRGADSMAYRNTAISRARNRQETIREWIMTDEHKDRLIEKHPVPKGVTCDLCGKAMRFNTHFFDVQSIPLLFVFECPANHGPRKAIYPNGQEHVFPKPTCKKCGYEVARESHNQNNILYTTTTCSMCGTVEKDELDLNFEPEEEFMITEEDRQKYCLSFFKERTFMEDLEAINNFVIRFDEDQKDKELKEHYEIDKIERLTIPALETRLQKAIENEGFIKLGFDRPEMKTWTVVPFNLQDPTDRNDKKSIKTITSCIKQTIFTTNWRLVGSIDYRLGFLTGKLKAYEREEDLIKLAIEIKGNVG
ncbi:hypothetical protein [Chitinophaga filiformis]|uniref:Uncharacterized protein n=1 Tax=Chitinophaga filiformis TaxID=104663 RepID=A0ABY4IB76_CHIFI|nr:hypothetical protein [Chitinophaga filiformis]UPK72464.1 hypothetical protein MYF79_14320 [Chitinophaga filiformis]